MQTNTRTYVCKRLRLCRYLMEHGFQPYQISPDRDNPRYDVYLFNQSDELTAAVTEYLTDPTLRKLNERRMPLNETKN